MKEIKQLSLFEKEPLKSRKGKCKDCFYFDWVIYDSGRKIFYCNLRKSNRTHNGQLKIKMNDVVCNLYKEDK